MLNPAGRRRVVSPSNFAALMRTRMFKQYPFADGTIRLVYDDAADMPKMHELVVLGPTQKQYTVMVVNNATKSVIVIPAVIRPGQNIKQVMYEQRA